MDTWLIITLSIVGALLLGVLIFSVILLRPKQTPKVKKVKLEYLTPKEDEKKVIRTKPVSEHKRSSSTGPLFVVAIAIVILEVIFLRETLSMWQLVLLTTGSAFIVFSLQNAGKKEERVTRGVTLFIGKVLVISALFNYGLANHKLFLFIFGIPLIGFLLYIFFNFMRGAASAVLITIIGTLGSGLVVLFSIIGLIVFGWTLFFVFILLCGLGLLLFVGGTIFHAISRIIV